MGTPGFVQFGRGKYSVSDNLVQFNSTQIYLPSRIVRQYNKFCTKYEVGLPERRIYLWIPMITGISAEIFRTPTYVGDTFHLIRGNRLFFLNSIFIFIFCVCMWVCAWLISSMHSHCYNRWPAWWALQLFW